MLSEHSRILIIDQCHQAFMEALNRMDITYLPDIGLDQLETEIKHCEVLIVRSKLHINQEWIDKAPDLRIIGRLGSGMDIIDVDYAQSRGIVCLNAPEGNRATVAEQCIGMLLSLLANIHRSNCQLQEGNWNRKGNSGIELSSRTVGIVGFGNVGSSLAKRLAPFGCKILAYDRFKQGFGNQDVEEVSLEKLKEEANVISLHVPLNKYSNAMIDKEFIESVRQPFYLLNLSRGEVVNSNDLRAGLDIGKITGLALDVFEEERIEKMDKQQKELFDYFVSHPQVIFTPHIGGLSAQSFERLASVLAHKVLTYFT